MYWKLLKAIFNTPDRTSQPGEMITPAGGPAASGPRGELYQEQKKEVGRPEGNVATLRTEEVIAGQFNVSRVGL